MADAGLHVPTPAESLREYGRGLAGGLLFSVPLLYTMEVWWAGFIARPDRILVYLAAVFVLLLGYNRYAGLRQDASPAEVFIDSVEELGLGIVTAAGMLFLLGRIGPLHSLEETLGKVLIEAGIVAIGFSVGTAQLQGSSDDDGADAKDDDTGMADEQDREPHLGSGLVIAACGAVLFASNVAPTEEIVVIAVQTAPSRLMGLVIVSMTVAMLVLYFSDFVHAKRRIPRASAQGILAGTVVTYGIALAASAAILWFFGRFDGASAEVVVRQTLVLGLPAVLGASAGRLLIHR
jgi:putative integral membrane protein (TIGR02587 family)